MLFAERSDSFGFTFPEDVRSGGTGIVNVDLSTIMLSDAMVCSSTSPMDSATLVVLNESMEYQEA